ncbi:hypothetical protein BB559_001713 [Furculomyces boomerangus]|uniref:Glutamate--cysteine ligase n=2 Tax=Harpellales TaxID=61421 RepID=A0A2T9Y5S9_9FUNG|nr:hypothetical protein BB559_005938 [Furculomyces boomerangus]PVU98228.1 hypothetical protein BB559_001713 [Furculomyces boomerangus]PVZ96535.1 hypothetical protein BB558_007561 [Smittium angustum]
MGLLSLGTPLDWPEAKKHADHVRKNGIEQFINIWKRIKDKERDSLLWGDEIEYVVVEFDHENKKTRLVKHASEVIDKLQVAEMDYLEKKEKGLDATPPKSLWRPEFGSFMVEGTPGEPYGSNIKDLVSVEESMIYRRNETMNLLNKNQSILSITSYPMMGTKDWFTPFHEPDGIYFQSLFLSDEIINPHPRFRTLAANIRQRRGSKVEINMPIFHDVNTPRPFIDDTIPWDRQIFPGDSEAKNGAAKPDHIYMDAMGFGMGSCCLQVTFQASSMNEARRLYDQLAPSCSIMMALSAATPLLRGFLADIDCRWNIISASVDDRTPQERGLEPLSGKSRLISKSRYGTIDSYLGSSDGFFSTRYNDVKLEYDEDLYKVLVGNGVDEQLARHIGHLFIRDPLVIYKELLDLDNEKSSDHFENIQSTNWQNVRFKPPPPGTDIGWRVEFRPIESQVTDFENAAYAIFIVLLTRAILSFDLDFYLPISQMDINMERAHKRDAVLNEKFYFRKNVFSRQSRSPSPNVSRSVSSESDGSSTSEKENGNNTSQHLGKQNTSQIFLSSGTGSILPVIEEMTINEIMNGQKSKGGFPGLLPIVYSYLNSANVDVITMSKLRKYLEFIRNRATGEYKTNASWIRSFVTSHPEYKKDSRVNDRIVYDLLMKLDEASVNNKPVF